jgi:hypothetical protein
VVCSAPVRGSPSLPARLVNRCVLVNRSRQHIAAEAPARVLSLGLQLQRHPANDACSLRASHPAIAVGLRARRHRLRQGSVVNIAMVTIMVQRSRLSNTSRRAHRMGHPQSAVGLTILIRSRWLHLDARRQPRGPRSPSSGLRVIRLRNSSASSASNSHDRGAVTVSTRWRQQLATPLVGAILRCLCVLLSNK